MAVFGIAARVYHLLPFSLRDRLAHRRLWRSIERRSAAGFAELAGRRGLLLDIGSSSNHLPGWISLDLLPDEQALRLDAAKPWPLADGSARAIRSEHMIEHIGLDEARAFLREAFRVLEPGGRCRTCTPDLEGIARLYLERDPALLAAHRAHGYVAPTWAHFVNNYVYLYGHRFIYDFEALAELLGAAGFEQIERVAYGESRHPELVGTDSHFMDALEPIVLCVDAVKPRSGS